MYYSDDLFRTLVDAVPGGIIAANLDGTIVLVNDRAELLFGYTRDEMIGATIEMLLPERFREDHTKYRKGYFANPSSRPMGIGRDLAAQRKDGTEFPVEIGLSYTVTSSGPVTLALVTDITERKRAEEALRQSEERFRTLVQTVPNAILSIDTEGRILFVNERAEALFGYTREELIGSTVEVLLPERFRQGHVGMRRSYFANPSARPMGMGRDLAARRKEGTEFPVEIGLSYTMTNEGLVTLAFITDITERKRAEAAVLGALTGERVAHSQVVALHGRLAFLLDVSSLLAESFDYVTRLKQFAQLVVSQVADLCAIHLVETDGAITQVAVAFSDPSKDAQLAELQRRSLPDSIVPQSVYQVLQSGQTEFYPEITDDMLSNTAGDREYLRFLREVGFTSIIIMPLTTDKRVVGVITLALTGPGRQFMPDDLELAREVARRAALRIENARLYQQAQLLNTELERRVIERTAQLEAANRELEAFSYSISHDLRAPLRAIDGFSRIILRDYSPQLPEEAQRRLELVRTNAQQMGQLIDDLLAFSRLNRQAVEKKSVAPTDLVYRALDELSSEQEKRQLEFIIEDLPVCYADPALLKQVFVNLLANALKFTRQREVARIEVGSCTIDGQLTYFVKDNGAGFDIQYADKLFGVFQRLHSVEEYEGTGVGLAIVQRIIHHHNGHIWAEAAVDEGAIFYFTLQGEL